MHAHLVFTGIFFRCVKQLGMFTPYLFHFYGYTFNILFFFCIKELKARTNGSKCCYIHKCIFCVKSRLSFPMESFMPNRLTVLPEGAGITAQSYLEKRHQDYHYFYFERLLKAKVNLTNVLNISMKSLRRVTWKNKRWN